MTPWQKVIAAFGGSQADVARALGKHRSKISRAARDRRGLINGADQVLILEAARKRGLAIDPLDLVPSVGRAA